MEVPACLPPDLSCLLLTMQWEPVVPSCKAFPNPVPKPIPRHTFSISTSPSPPLWPCSTQLSQDNYCICRLGFWCFFFAVFFLHLPKHHEIFCSSVVWSFEKMTSNVVMEIAIQIIYIYIQVYIYFFHGKNLSPYNNIPGMLRAGGMALVMDTNYFTASSP